MYIYLPLKIILCRGLSLKYILWWCCYLKWDNSYNSFLPKKNKVQSESSGIIIPMTCAPAGDLHSHEPTTFSLRSFDLHILSLEKTHKGERKIKEEASPCFGWNKMWWVFKALKMCKCRERKGFREREWGGGEFWSGG